MKPKSLMLFAVAAGCGLVAMVGAQQLLSSRGQGAPKIRVLIARAEVEPGVKLNADLVGFRELPQDAVPEGAVTQEEQYTDRALRVRAFPGQVIQVAQLGEKGQFGTSLDIPSGMRLASIPASDTMTHSGIMKPGDRVDVVLTYKQNKRTKAGSETVTLTKTILEYIQVYAIGNQRMGNEENEVKGTAKDAKNKGELHLTLRSVLDKQLVASKGTDEAQLEYLRGELADEKLATDDRDEGSKPAATEPVEPVKPSFAEFVQAEPEATPAPPPVVETPKWKVEVFQGDERKVYEVDDPNAVTPPAVTPAAQPAAVTAVPSLWGSPLTKWLTGTGRPSAKPAANNTLAQ